MSEEQQGVWLDEDTYVEEDGTTHKAVPMGTSCNCSLLKMCNTAYIPCRPEDRTDGKQVSFAIVQKVEVDKCK
jgi:hypothetical protein